jgi:hypothetical protein
LPAGVACEPDDGALLCAYQNLPAGQPAPTTRAFFKTADLPATDTIITVTALVNERANDTNPCASGDPNCDEFALPITNPYEPRNDAAFTHALNGKSFHLTSNDGLSSFDFTSLSQSIFFASFKVLPPSTTHCFSTVVCFDRTLFSDTEQAPGFSTSNPVVFYIKLIDPPAGVTTKSLSAIHFYDAGSFATLGGRLFPPTSEPSYGNNGMDGLRLSSATAAALGIPFTDGKYFIVGHNGGDNSFRISLTKGGAALNPVNNAGFLGEPIRIIGDQSSERSTISCTTEAPAGLVVPSICVKKDGPKALEAWVWDRANGYVQW